MKIEAPKATWGFTPRKLNKLDLKSAVLRRSVRQLVAAAERGDHIPEPARSKLSRQHSWTRSPGRLARCGGRLKVPTAGENPVANLQKPSVTAQARVSTIFLHPFLHRFLPRSGIPPPNTPKWLATVQPGLGPPGSTRDLTPVVLHQQEPSQRRRIRDQAGPVCKRLLNPPSARGATRLGPGPQRRPCYQDGIGFLPETKTAPSRQRQEGEK